MTRSEVRYGMTVILPERYQGLYGHKEGKLMGYSGSKEQELMNVKLTELLTVRIPLRVLTPKPKT